MVTLSAISKVPGFQLPLKSLIKPTRFQWLKPSDQDNRVLFIVKAFLYSVLLIPIFLCITAFHRMKDGLFIKNPSKEIKIKKPKDTTSDFFKYASITAGLVLTSGACYFAYPYLKSPLASNPLIQTPPSRPLKDRVLSVFSIIHITLSRINLVLRVTSIVIKPLIGSIAAYNLFNPVTRASSRGVRFNIPTSSSTIGIMLLFSSVISSRRLYNLYIENISI